MGRPADPIVRLARAIKQATRPALEATFHHWRDHMAQYHFDRAAFTRYPKEYAASAKRDRATYMARRRRKGKTQRVQVEAKPLVRTRAFRQAFLHGSVLFTGSYTSLRVRWASIPRHATLKNKFSAFSAAEAVTTVSKAEWATLTKVYHGSLLQFAERDSQIPLRTHGRAAI